MKKGDVIIIKEMHNEPSYNGRKGTIEFIDAIGQLHGTWGPLALIPGLDKYELFKQTNSY